MKKHSITIGVTSVVCVLFLLYSFDLRAKSRSAKPPAAKQVSSGGSRGVRVSVAPQRSSSPSPEQIGINAPSATPKNVPSAISAPKPAAEPSSDVNKKDVTKKPADKKSGKRSGKKYGSKKGKGEKSSSGKRLGRKGAGRKKASEQEVQKQPEVQKLPAKSTAQPVEKLAEQTELAEEQPVVE